MRHRATDKKLRRWLETGRPRWVGEAVVDDPSIAERVDQMTALSPADLGALERLVEPPPQFGERVASGVRQRIDNYGTVALLADLVGLGYHVGRALLPPHTGQAPRKSSTDDATRTTPGRQ